MLKKYKFPNNPSTHEYCVFPTELEEDDLVLFHATPIKNFESIVADGFKIPDKQGVHGLPSVSFAKKSSSALTYAMMRRCEHPGDWCIIAVRYKTLERKCLKNNLCNIHDYSLDPAPEIIGYCIVPKTYEHV